MGEENLILAYMGPGAGIAAVGALIGVAWIVVNVIVGLVWYPVRMFRRWRRERSGAEERPGGVAEAGSPAAGETTPGASAG